MNIETSLLVAKALADRSRLLILQTLRHGPLPVEEIAATLELAPSTASFHLKKLTVAGLVVSRRDQYYTLYSLVPEALARTLDELVDSEAESLRQPADRAVGDSRRVLATFFSEGRLLKMPAQKRKRAFVLERFAALFDENRTYSEPEVNELITPFFPDYCLIRRLLIDEGHLTRTGPVYERTPLRESGERTDMDEQKRLLKQRYKLEGRTPGIFRVRNLVTGKVFLGSAIDLNGPLNRIRFQLEHGSYRDRALQADYDRLGAEAFAFEILDKVEAGGRPPDELEGELEKLETTWASTLDPENTYNTSERLRFP
ncbi:MAG: metalloregulator ArsR/SmtB family transcription factor [Thermoleophilia bacterium]